jgi:D-alanine-D-alanine ligase
MKIAVCFNQAPAQAKHGEQLDRISEADAKAEAEAVAKALRLLGHAPLILPLGNQLTPFINALQKAQPLVVFNLCEGFWGESRHEQHVAALLQLLKLEHSGSSPLALGLTQNKVLTKDLLSQHGLPTPHYLLVAAGETVPVNHQLNWPLIVKPCREDASLGITSQSVVDNTRALTERVNYIHKRYQQGALIEEFIDGREFNVALLGDREFKVLPIAEICFGTDLNHQIVSYAGKWLEKSNEYAATQPICPALLTLQEQTTMEQVAQRACHLLGCRDYARVDIRLRAGIPYILEVNANPDISPNAGLARAASAAGLEYPALIGHILELCLTRLETVHA